MDVKVSGSERLLSEAAIIRESGLFDTDWYCARYPDVAEIGIDPVVHYLKYGALLTRDPSPQFSTSFYSDISPESGIKGINPLINYIMSRDKNKNKSRNVLWAANRLAKRNFKLALELAKDLIPDDMTPALEILGANAALADDARWLTHLNKYLANFNAAPVKLKPEGPTRFHRLACNPPPRVETGPLISVIMPAWNAEKTLDVAARSILDQTWRSLELIIIDDASTDATWAVMKRLAAETTRVRILQNSHNVGPYVSKNIAIKHAIGEYITGHDADDWAHPQRIEKQIYFSQGSEYGKASLCYMIRMTPEGNFSHISKPNHYSPDSVRRRASISCLFDSKFLREVLGGWDSVRFGADSEIIARANLALNNNLLCHDLIGMICLDIESSLTNHQEHGVSKVSGISPIRKNYQKYWKEWHRNLLPNQVYLDFPQATRRFEAPADMCVNPELIAKVT